LVFMNRLSSVAFVLCSFIMLSQFCFAQNIRTIAGNGGVDSSSGDGGLAINASIGNCYGVAVDSRGNVYTTTNNLNFIRKVTPAGMISTIAGTGYPGYSGDGGPATAARISAPFGITVDSSDNIYFADGGNLRIRKIDTGGIISTVAGIGGFGCFSADNVSAVTSKVCAVGVFVDRNQNLFIADGNSRVRKVDPYGQITTVVGNGSVGYSGSGGAATNATIEGPTDITVGPDGTLYEVESANYVIRQVNAGNVISVFTGTGSPTSGSTADGARATSTRLSSPNGICSDLLGNIYYTDLGLHRVRRIDTTDRVRTFAGSSSTPGFGGDGGPATAARLSFPTDAVFDRWGNMYIADRGTGSVAGIGHRIRQVYFVDTFHIAALPSDTLCGTRRATFVAMPLVPHYYSKVQWFINGLPVGPDSLAFTADSLRNGDIVTCSIVDGNLTSAVLAVSDTIRITAGPIVLPRVGMRVSRDTLCARDTLTLTADALNGGPSPVFTWTRFGTVIGTGQTIVYTPSFGDIVTVVMRSNALCAARDTAMAVKSVITRMSYEPLVTVRAHPNDTIAYWGQIIALFTESTFGGSAPTYQWYRNGRVIPGATNTTFNEEVYANDTLYCVMRSNLACVIPPTDTSNIIYISIGSLSVNDRAQMLERIAIAPNPTGLRVTATGLGNLPTNQEMNIQVLDISGKTILNSSFAYDGSGDLSFLLPENTKNGTYYVVLTVGDARTGIPISVLR
jgi:hypothetical protein